WEALVERCFVRLNVPQPFLPFAEGNYPTPSGKCEFYSERMAADGYDPLPTYIPPAWQRGASPEASLVCISPPAHSFLNSTFANVERFVRREAAPWLHMHPDDAAARGIVEGMAVSVSNERGSVQLTAKITRDIVPGTVLAPGIWWAKHSPDLRNINRITAQDEADMGAGATFYDARVWVTPAHPAAGEQEEVLMQEAAD